METMNSRIIKFRYRYTDGKNWIFKVFNLDQISYGAPVLALDDHPLLRVYVLDGQDQFTGLHDKDGKEIYDRDHVKDGSPWVWTVRFGECKCEGVDFVGWYLEHPERDDFSGPFTKFDQSVIQIIGNEFEGDSTTLK